MNIEKHHLSGLSLAITLIDQSVEGKAIKAKLIEAIATAQAAEGMTYEELEHLLAQQNDELEQYHEMDRRAEQERLMEERTERIVDTLFPNYNRVAMKKEEYPIRHPDKEWWWNGASLVESYITHKGTLHLEVSSYIGCGENETFECEVPAQWLELEDPTETIHKWCLDRSSAMSEAKRQRDIREAQAEIQRQAARLSQLQSKQ